MDYNLDKKLTAATASPVAVYFSFTYPSPDAKSLSVVDFLLPICLQAYSYDSLPLGAKTFMDISAIASETVGERIVDNSEIKEIVETIIDELPEEKQDALQELGQQFAEFANNPPTLVEDEPKPIKNKDSFLDVDWLDEEDMEVIGSVGNTPLVLIGREQGTNASLVARDDREYYHAVMLSDLLSHSQDSITLKNLRE